MKKIVKKLFSEMLRIRRIEEKISQKYKEQKMRCPVHLSIGQEATPVGICYNLKKDDKIVTAHRSHAHYLAKGGDLKAMISELYGKITGCAKGKGGSMHLIDLKAGVSAAVPIVGSTIPIGVGISWAIKLKKQKKIVVIFFGDGATESGVFQESLDFASLHDLPVLFVCENNDYSVYSHLKKRQSLNRNIIKMANAMGIKGSRLDGNNVLEIYKKTKKIIINIKKNSKPYILLLNTFRHFEHCGPNNDDHLGYRSRIYIKQGLESCPLRKLSKKIKKTKILSNNEMKEIEKNIRNEIDIAFKFAENSAYPNKNFLMKHIYEK